MCALLDCSMFSDETKNQHFVSQTEQRLNALNPNAGVKNMRIYSFTVTDREQLSYELETPKGSLISRTLSYDDLFSFDVPGGAKVRENFESLFGRYEATVGHTTDALLRKLRGGDANVSGEINALLPAKFLNLVRNPFSITKILNTFDEVFQYRPTDPEHFAVYNRIVEGRKPHSKYLCRDFGVDDDQYERWLRTIFMLLGTTPGEGTNRLEEILDTPIVDPSKVVLAMVFDFDDAACLLSDRGCVIDERSSHLMIYFNLTSNSFVILTISAPADARLGRFAGRIDVRYHRNNIAALKAYNSYVISTCYRQFFCAQKRFLL